MQIEEIQISGMSCKLFLPGDYHEGGRHYPVIYINGEVPVEEIVTEVNKAGHRADFILLSIQPASWNDDFTPWSAPAFRRGEEAPRGCADAYLSRLAGEIKPYIDAHYRTKPEPEHTVLLGYSLGGLVALYSIYKTDLSGAVGVLSGSLWYDGFCEFMEKAKPMRTDIKVYFSLGKKESQSRNPRMGRVAECTERAREILARQLIMQNGQIETQAGQFFVQREQKKQGKQNGMRHNPTGAANVYFEWNEGGHFHEIAKRFAKAIIWWLHTEQGAD